jgi:hypothetical protein
MSVPSGDYNNFSSSGGPNCHYSNLDRYNNEYYLESNPPQFSRVMPNNLVKLYSPANYQTLMSGIPSCTGYYKITSAYKNVPPCRQPFK